MFTGCTCAELPFGFAFFNWYYRVHQIGLAVQELAELPLLTLMALKMMNWMVQQAFHKGGNTSLEVSFKAWVCQSVIASLMIFFGFQLGSVMPRVQDHCSSFLLFSWWIMALILWLTHGFGHELSNRMYCIPFLFRRSHFFGGLKGAVPCEECSAFGRREMGVSKVQFLAMWWPS